MLAWPRECFFPNSATFNRVRVPGAPPPRVSILVLASNDETAIDDTLRTAARQSYRDIELVICDIGSTDRTAHFIRNHAAGDVRIRVLDAPPPGKSPWPALADAAKGQLLAPTRGYDTCHPERIERLVNLLDDHPDIVAAGSNYVELDLHAREQSASSLPLEHDAILASLSRGEGGMYHGSCLVRRSAFEEVGGYRAETVPAETTDLLLRLGTLGCLANLPDALVRHRVDSPASRRIAEDAREAARFVASGKLESASAVVPPGGAVDHGWQALESGHRETARGHSLAALRRRPFSPEAWRLFLSTMRSS